MQPKLIIWDWNGTVLDDTEATWQIANTMLTERGIKSLADLDAYRAVFGFPIRDYYQKIGYTFEKESYEAVADEFVILYAEAFKSCPLMPGAVETLHSLKKMGCRQVLLSATKRSQLLDQVARFPELSNLFTDILGIQDHYAFSKAHLAAEFISSCGLRPEETLFIGDTDHDCEVSSAVGAPCLLIAKGHQSRSRLEKTSALTVLNDVREVPQWIADAPAGGR